MKIILVISLTVLTMVGCNQSEQRGKFVVSTNQRVALQGQNGSVILLRGRGFNERNKEISLLGVIVVDPRGLASFNGGEVDHKHLVSRIEIANLRSVPKKIYCDWQRETDSISVAGVQFDRSAGEIFLVVLAAEDKFDVMQLKAEDKMFSANDIVELARNSYPQKLEGVNVPRLGEN